MRYSNLFLLPKMTVVRRMRERGSQPLRGDPLTGMYCLHALHRRHGSSLPRVGQPYYRNLDHLPPMALLATGAAMDCAVPPSSSALLLLLFALLPVVHSDSVVE